MSDAPDSGEFRWTKETTVGLIAFVLFLGLSVVIFDRWIMPPRTPTFDRPSAFDVLIDSRLVVGLIRLIAIILALYVIISVFAHIRSRRWIVTFGGAQTSATDRTELQERLAAAEDKYKTLTGEYENLVTLLSEVLEAVPDYPEVGGGDNDSEPPSSLT